MLCYYLNQQTRNKASDKVELLFLLFLLQKELRSHLHASQTKYFSLQSELSDQAIPLFPQQKCPLVCAWTSCSALTSHKITFLCHFSVITTHQDVVEVIEQHRGLGRQVSMRISPNSMASGWATKTTLPFSMHLAFYLCHGLLHRQFVCRRHQHCELGSLRIRLTGLFCFQIATYLHRNSIGCTKLALGLFEWLWVPSMSDDQTPPQNVPSENLRKFTCHYHSK